MKRIYNKNSNTTTGFSQQHSVYQTKNCNGCPMRGQCFNAKGDRRIEINHKLQYLKVKARAIESEVGKHILKQKINSCLLMLKY